MESAAITFDVGGTLIEPFPSVGHVYAEVGARHGHPGLSTASLGKSFATAWHQRVIFNHTRSEWAALVDDTFRAVTGSPVGEACFQELFERFAQADAWRIFPDVIPVLQSLAARGLNLAVISNWDERLRPLLHRLNLFTYFRKIIVSCEVGAAKPSPLIFERAAQQLSLAPGAILHIGDSPRHDVDGARAAGFQAFWLNRETRSAASGQINSLTALLDLCFTAGE